MQLSFPVCQMMTCKLHFSPEPVSFYSKENSSLSCWDFNTQLSDVEAETWDPPPWRICELCNYEVGRLEGSSVFPVDSYFFCLLFEVYLESNIIPPVFTFRAHIRNPHLLSYGLHMANKHPAWNLGERPIHMQNSAHTESKYCSLVLHVALEGEKKS